MSLPSTVASIKKRATRTRDKRRDQKKAKREREREREEERMYEIEPSNEGSA